MTAPNQAPQAVQPMPELGGEPAPIPRFESPKPTAGQKVTMKLAGVALGLGRQASPKQTLEELVVRTGGYKPKLNGKYETTYTHDGSKPKINPAAYDETAKGATVAQYRTHADFEEASSGTTLLGAVRRTVDKSRTAPNRKPNAREKVASKLVARATKRGAETLIRS
ncbi:MAG: hypothetical protein H6799_01105 [Candidatus Nomurabacteria bacterium]|nr:MAG: hypothetical protein H6799_01105 [Candidatus Nomurabacteria bacterium]